MKALTLWQPWAGLMAAGVKRIETRGHLTHYRGDLLIHAAKGNYDEYISNQLHAFLDAQPWLKPFIEPKGAILCKVNLYDCREILATASGKYPMFFIPEMPAVPEAELLFGDYSPGRFGYLTKDLVTFKEPIPCSGKQGLWNYEGPLP